MDKPKRLPSSFSSPFERHRLRVQGRSPGERRRRAEQGGLQSLQLSWTGSKSTKLEKNYL